MNSPAMDRLIVMVDAQARRSAIRIIKKGARRFLAIPRNYDWISTGHPPVSLETINRWFGFGGETQLLYLKSAQLYKRYRRFVIHVNSRRNAA